MQDVEALTVAYLSAIICDLFYSNRGTVAVLGVDILGHHALYVPPTSVSGIQIPHFLLPSSVIMSFPYLEINLTSE